MSLLDDDVMQNAFVLKLFRVVLFFVSSVFLLLDDDVMQRCFYVHVFKLKHCSGILTHQSSRFILFVIYCFFLSGMMMLCCVLSLSNCFELIHFS